MALSSIFSIINTNMIVASMSIFGLKYKIMLARFAQRRSQNNYLGCLPVDTFPKLAVHVLNRPYTHLYFFVIFLAN